MRQIGFSDAEFAAKKKVTRRERFLLGLSDEGVEGAVYDSDPVRRFVGVDLATESVPDATMSLKFRRLLKSHGLTRKLFGAINAGLESAGLLHDEEEIVLHRCGLHRYAKA